MSLFFLICLAVVIIYRWHQNRTTPNDGLGPILGHAKEYGPCPNCGERNTQSARGRGEVITRGGHYVVRQYHVCANCNARALWHRRLDLWVWTIIRNGVADSWTP